MVLLSFAIIRGLVMEGLLLRHALYLSSHHLNYFEFSPHEECLGIGFAI
jgi:hypothetical protein